MILLAEIKTSEGQTLALIQVTDKAFKTGSRGFYGNGKIEIAGKRYQTQVQLVEIGSKLASLPAAAKQPARTLQTAHRGSRKGDR